MNYPEIIRKILFWVCSGSRCRNVLYGCQFAILVFQWWLSGWLVRGESAVEHADVGSSDSESCWRRAAGLYDAEAARREDAAWHQSTARGRPAARGQHRADHCSLGKPRHSSVRQVRLLAWWPGTHSRILSAIQRAAQTILGVFLKHTCLRITSVSSALGVVNGYVLYISTHSLALTQISPNEIFWGRLSIGPSEPRSTKCVICQPATNYILAMHTAIFWGLWSYVISDHMKRYSEILVQVHLSLSLQALYTCKTPFFAVSRSENAQVCPGDLYLHSCDHPVSC